MQKIRAEIANENLTKAHNKGLAEKRLAKLEARLKDLEDLTKWQAGLLSFLAGRSAKDSIEFHNLMAIIARDVAIGEVDPLVKETIEEIRQNRATEQKTD